MNDTSKAFNIGDKFYALIIEWFGNKPPSTWYRRMKEITAGEGTAIRPTGGNELDGLMARLGDAQKGEPITIVAQEGCIMSQSLSILEGLFTEFKIIVHKIDAQNAWLNVENPKPLPIGFITEMSVYNNFQPSARAVEGWDRINRVASKKGRKPKAENWVVTCLECQTVTYQEVATPTQCSNCGGTIIHNRKGSMVIFKNDEDIDIFEFWKKTRFFGPHFEPTPIDYVGTIDTARHPDSIDESELLLQGKARKMVELMNGSELIRQVHMMPRETAMEFLDAVYASRLYLNDELRKDRRSGAIVAYWQYFLGDTEPTLTPPLMESEPDIFDASISLGKSHVTEWALKLDYAIRDEMEAIPAEWNK